MAGGEVNQYPILLLVNYWEIRPARMGARLDELVKQGVNHFATFVPWQAAESDISNTLTRFLQAVAERNMQVDLILSPEVGVHYPNSGLPKDLVAKKDSRAQHCHSGPVLAHLPPNAFHLPSLLAPDFTKRYYSFIARMDGVFADLARGQPSLMRGVRTILTGSLWKYYRSPAASSQATFGGSAGDYSSHAALAYRQRVEQFYSQREFMDPTPAEANRWKTRSVEEVNRRWFYQQSENVFRGRSVQLVKKRSTHLKVSEIELYTPEADPSLSYGNFLQMVSGGHGDFGRLSDLLDQTASRTSFASDRVAAPWAHWTCMGGFRMLADAEKQFLFLKSLLLTGGEGGGLLIDEAEWFSFSGQFRSRTEAIARSLSERRFQLKPKAYYLVPHLWSDYGTLWEELLARLGPNAKMIASLDGILMKQSSNLLIVDPSCVLTRAVIQKLVAWVKAGRIVVLPKSRLYTDLAKNELEHAVHHAKRMEIDLGFTYQLYSLGDGKLIVYEVPEAASLKGEALSAWKVFVNAVLSIAEVENYCRLSDSRLTMIPLELEGDRFAAFILNASRRSVTTDIIFSTDVRIADLGLSIVSDSSREQSFESVAASTRFTLEVPPFGVLPLLVDGLKLNEQREKKVAQLESLRTRESAMSAAMAELPGFGSLGEGMDEVWS
jgi:hypothetical protein